MISQPPQRDDCSDMLDRLESSVKDLILKIEQQSQKFAVLEQSLTEHAKDINDEID